MPQNNGNEQQDRRPGGGDQDGLHTAQAAVLLARLLAAGDNVFPNRHLQFCHTILKFLHAEYPAPTNDPTGCLLYGRNNHAVPGVFRRNGLDRCHISRSDVRVGVVLR